jgi:hypothetical protein
MKNVWLLLVCALFCPRISAQQTFNDSLALSRNRLTEKAMITLGGWAAANIISGFVISGRAQGEAKYAWQMNAYWNLINGGLAVMGYINARKAMEKKYRFSENNEAQQSIEKLYVFNAGLDIAYITGGFLLREKGLNTTNQKSRDQFGGYGTSIAVQGGFLLLMDAVMITLHHKNSIRLNKKLSSLDLGAGPGGLGLSYRF